MRRLTITIQILDDDNYQDHTTREAKVDAPRSVLSDLPISAIYNALILETLAIADAKIGLSAEDEDIT